MMMMKYRNHSRLPNLISKIQIVPGPSPLDRALAIHFWLASIKPFEIRAQ